MARHADRADRRITDRVVSGAERGTVGSDRQQRCASRKSSIFFGRIVGVSLTTSAMSRHTFSVQAAGAGSHQPKSWRGRPWQRSPDSFRCPLSALKYVSLHHDGVCTKHLFGHPADHDDSCELPPREGGGSPNQCFGHSRMRTSANPGIPARTPRLRLPRLATTAELRVIDLIAQHDPEANPELPRRRDAGLREALLHHLPSIEAR
jgi:hypothetical protein